MLGPGEYVPDVTEGISSIVDLPQPRIEGRSRNYQARRCPRCKTRTALRRLEKPRKRVRWFKRLALAKLNSPNLEKALLFLDDKLLGSTSNAVERSNRLPHGAEEHLPGQDQAPSGAAGRPEHEPRTEGQQTCSDAENPAPRSLRS
jgi:hypothetical protein